MGFPAEGIGVNHKACLAAISMPEHLKVIDLFPTLVFYECGIPTVRTEKVRTAKSLEKPEDVPEQHDP